MSYAGALRALQAHARALPGVLDAPDNVPESAILFPFAVTYPRSGTLIRNTDTLKGLHVVYTEIHVDRSLLPEAIETAQGYITSFANRVLNDPTLGDNVNTLQVSNESPITYEFGRLEWGTTKTIGVRFIITFKIQGLFT